MESSAAKMAARPAVLAVAFAALVIALPGDSLSQQPAPTSPTIPMPAVGRHNIAHPMSTVGTKAQPAEPVPNGNKAELAPLPELSLGECVAIALERQPALKAVLASQEATEAGLRGLNNIGRVGQAISKDLPIRKQQAERGVIAAAADVQKVHNEIVQDATRLYYTAVYARQQEAIADDVVGMMETLVKLAEDLLKVPMSGMTTQKVNMMKIGLAKARSLRATAQIGQKQALAALREVMGVEESFQFRVRDKELPVMAANASVPLTKELVVEKALGGRPELALAAAGVDAFRLEVYAQSRLPFRRAVPTLASGSDIHSRDVPQTSRGKEYRPGAIAPEMPTQLVGTKYDRVCRAMAYSHRAEAVFEKARNLIVLEAETAFYDLELAAQRATYAKAGFDSGKELAESVHRLFAEDREKDRLLQMYVAASQAQSEYVEAVYQHLLALTALERITAGGVRPAFPGR
jgi:outer membrane protein TolC